MRSRRSFPWASIRAWRFCPCSSIRVWRLCPCVSIRTCSARVSARLVSAVGVLVVNGKVDRLTGRVDELSRAFNSHVNASH